MPNPVYLIRVSPVLHEALRKLGPQAVRAALEQLATGVIQPVEAVIQPPVIHTDPDPVLQDAPKAVIQADKPVPAWKAKLQADLAARLGPEGGKGDLDRLVNDPTLQRAAQRKYA